jgi:Mg2+/citrate symporter
VKHLGSLDMALGSGFVVRPVSDAALYDVVDTSFRTAAMAVVVDLDTVPTYTLASLHALLPEVKIVGLSDSWARTGYYRSIGVAAVLPRSAPAKAVGATIKSLLR